MAARKYDSPLRAQQARDTRRRILESAARITVLDIRLLTHASVARAAGVAERTVYRHFPTAAALHDAFGRFQNERFGYDKAERFELGDLPGMFERWPERIEPSGALEAVLEQPEPELILETRRKRYQRLERALGRALPDTTPKQRRQLALVFGALMSAELFRRAKLYLKLEPKAAAPGPVWAMRVLIEKLKEGDTPWK